jgi:predicted AAA+ superfamily ATPase
MKRLVDQKLAAWKARKGRKPLIIRGARQVGKTYSVEQFGTREFEVLVSVDFELEKSTRSAFEGDLLPEKILLQLEAACEKRVVPGKTLLFLDEIQQCPRALAALRYFYEKMPELHVIAAGSALELAMGEYSFPVGRVEFEWMRPMGFEEFLWATGHGQLAENIPDLDAEEAVPSLVHERLMEQLRNYFFVGGMPEAVEYFARTGSAVEVTRVHRSLCQSYVRDFAKYTGRFDRDCIQTVFEQAPRRVSERIKYTSLYPQKRVETIKESLGVLEQALLINKVNSSAASGLPLGAAVSPKVFKCLFLDVGLMQHMCGVATEELFGGPGLLDVYRGALAEQFAGQNILLNGGSENDRVYYWQRARKGSSAEVDYLLVRKGRVMPVEVKSGAAGRLKSIRIFLDEHSGCDQGLALGTGNIRTEDRWKLKFMPLYTRC